MKRESHAMLAHQTKQVTFLLPKIGTQNETLDSDSDMAGISDAIDSAQQKGHANTTGI